MPAQLRERMIKQLVTEAAEEGSEGAAFIRKMQSSS